jgi:glutamyl/glutaminyl-tRNA synthetase
MGKNSNKIKADLLGMPAGTASARLKKMILFKLVKGADLDTCYRCGYKIEDIDELSIEHMISWQLSENPVETFFDLDNVSFSHLNCNVSAVDKTAFLNTKVFGEQQGLSKLKENDVIEIKQKLAKGNSQISIANEYGVTSTTIRKIKNAQTWTHITQ